MRYFINRILWNRNEKLHFMNPARRFFLAEYGNKYYDTLINMRTAHERPLLPCNMDYLVVLPSVLWLLQDLLSVLNLKWIFCDQFWNLQWIFYHQCIYCHQFLNWLWILPLVPKLTMHFLSVLKLASNHLSPVLKLAMDLLLSTLKITMLLMWPIFKLAMDLLTGSKTDNAPSVSSSEIYNG